ncbi:acyl CoA:acetate/3-ketoacid CoA transferase [Sinisalibacter lacisalsi]|uniref:Acetate CoA-transferase YdiF n=1 Tax=Sinisalibacter lacisalsi TaxID=1526570 RepID=A0ABQ1QH30_9RHOB|nr:CoA-transferase [Sinisalibacter lacisalsi]GGD25253.1 acetate CoA-transferase YdiF [Sinisalibacter lacisalsi]
MRDKFMSAAEAVALVEDGATVSITGGGGGLCEAMLLQEEIEKRFLETGHPRRLTLVHALGIGNRQGTGVGRFAHPGMVRKVIGGHWVWSPKMQEMAAKNEIEAHVLPGGVAMQLMREIAAGRPGLITHVGLGTFIDPRIDGGRMNEAARDPLCEVIEIDGREYLRYLPFPIHACLLKGSIADDEGNISLDEEPANVDTYAIAAAVHNSGGKVIFQVRQRVEAGELGARQVRIPGAIVDAIVVDPDQAQGYEIGYDPSISGQARVPLEPPHDPGFNPRRIIANRARLELREGAIVNFGYGIPDEIATILAARGESHLYYQTIEHGTYGGQLLTGTLFGYARNASCMIDGPSQFDFYAGGGLDIAFLGFGQIDALGNVNASRLGGLPVGPGGFIDIAQNARKVVFVGTFDAKGADIASGDGRLMIRQHGAVKKFVARVDQITFSGQQALRQGQEVLYVTERAVFRLTERGLALIETAPGTHLEQDILSQMAFAPQIETPTAMPEGCFMA